ncbi:MAG: hypothetical protein DLM65_15115 [Candidatus Aeolococcus gillhamiae]|uniref:Uncharacterized protein n=1 Tax=Candidatus Aeolococcus gillhamiae TaxID=3127015 RepID=A0A2W5YXK2_9BACT|nr:MAG: hypothetical protein DLM65_15115 [Candidatus Dormibacter sp. RRmetagenome_bin12]
MATTRPLAVTLAIAVGAVLAGCGSTVAPQPTLSPSSTTPSVATPGGALAGFLAAARNQDNSQVPVWLATDNDTSDLAELLRVYSDFGTSGGVFWEVDGVTVTEVADAGSGRANVTLSGVITWCVGKAANDPAATCSVVSPVAGTSHTYSAIQVDGRWKADVDVNASSSLDHNPEASPTASAPTPSPTPT